MKIFKIILFIGLFTFGIQSYAYTFTETIRFGATNSQDVFNLQEKLIVEGHLNGTPNGSVFATTSEAIKKFQRSNGLFPDGVVGPITRAVLNSSQITITPTTPTSQLNSVVVQPSVAVTPALGQPVFSNTNANQNQTLHGNLKTYIDSEWEPLCNGGPNECIDPVINALPLIPEALWLVSAEIGTFDDSVIKYLDVQIVACASDSGCTEKHEYDQLKRCRNHDNYSSLLVACN
jgi:hypothetical protein